MTEIVQIAHANKVPPQLIINWDQTGLNVVPARSWTMEEEGSRRVEIAGLGDKQQITATFAIAMSSTVLPVQMLYRKDPKMQYQLQLSRGLRHMANHWANTETTKRFISNIVVPYAAGVRAQMELHDSHPAIMSENHLISVRVPNNCTDRLQPLDLIVNKAIKDRLRQSFTDWYACQVKLQIESGKSIQDLRVDTRLSVMMKQNGLFQFTTTFAPTHL